MLIDYASFSLFFFSADKCTKEPKNSSVSLNLDGRQNHLNGKVPPFPPPGETILIRAVSFIYICVCVCVCVFVEMNCMIDTTTSWQAKEEEER